MTSTRRLNLILIEEDDADRRLAELVLTNSLPNCRIVRVSSGEGLFRATTLGPFDAVVTQLGVEQVRWSFLLQTIRALLPRTPVIVFARPEEEITAKAAVETETAAAFAIKSPQGFLDLSTAVAAAVAERAEPPRPANHEPEPEVDEAEPLAMSSVAQSRPFPTPSPRPAPPPPAAPPTEAPVTESGVAEPHRPIIPAPAEEEEQGGAPDSASAPFALDPVEPADPADADAPGEGKNGSWAGRPLTSILRDLSTPLLVVVTLALLAFFFSRLRTDVGSGAATEPTTSAPITAQPSAPDVSAVTPAISSPGESPVVENAAPVEIPPESEPESVPESEPESEPEPPTLATPVEDVPITVDVATAPINLELSAVDQVWIALVIDGETVLDVILEDGQSFAFEGQESAYLQVGNAAGLSVVWNGTDLGSLGRQGQVRHLLFSSDDVRPGRPGA